MAFIEAMDVTNMRVLGEKGTPELTARGVGNNLVALFFKLTRGLPVPLLDELYSAAEMEAKETGDPAALADLVVLAFQTRATRGYGKGEKALFFLLLKRLPLEAVLATLPLVSHYGYYKDLLLLLEVEGMPKAIADKAIELLAQQILKDEAELLAAAEQERTPQLSLCAKYAPREKGHFDRGGLRVAKLLALRIFGSANESASRRKYRQLLSKLNTALGTTEVLMASNRWAEIQFERVGSLCLQRQRKAFLNEKLKGTLTPLQEETGNRHPDDPTRVAARQHLREAMAQKSVKGKQLGPHEIVSKCMGRLSTLEKELMDTQWAAMRKATVELLAKTEAQRGANSGGLDETRGLDDFSSLKAALPRSVGLNKLVALVDVSGSMSGLPMHAAIGLGILVSELTHEAFRGRVLTFEEEPHWLDINKHKDIASKVQALRNAGWGGSTNFESALEMILSSAERARLSPDEVPDLIVFSDMQFDEAMGGSSYCRSKPAWETYFERIQRRFAEVGERICGQPYPAPRIIFWNLRANTVGFPAQADAPNTQMLSGFSPALLKLVLSGADLVADETVVINPDGSSTITKEGPTPEQTVAQALADTAFDPVRLALSQIEEGPLANYHWAGTME